MSKWRALELQPPTGAEEERLTAAEGREREGERDNSRRR